MGILMLMTHQMLRMSIPCPQCSASDCRHAARSLAALLILAKIVDSET